MRHVKLAIVLAFGLCAAYTSFAASPAATQAWVRQYIAAMEAEKFTRSFSADIDGTNVTLTIRYAAQPNAALRVASSGDARLPAGVCFAKTGPCIYQNFTNAVCDAVTLERFRCGWWFPSGFALVVSTNGAAVATNVVAATTNWVYKTAATFRVEDSVYRGFRGTNSFECVDIANPSNAAVIILKPHRQTSAERAATLAPQPSVSWLSLVLGRAFAGWTPGEWEYTGEYLKDSDDGQSWIYRKTRHYSFSSSGGATAIDSITVTIGQAFLSVDVSGLGLPELPADGTDACDYSGGSSLSMPDDAAIAAAIAQGLVNAGWDEAKAKAYAERFMEAQGDAIRGEMDTTLSGMNDELSSGLPDSCPENGEYSVPKPQDDPAAEPPENPPYSPSGCTHPRCAPGSVCGNWICAECGAQVDGPASHGDWQNRNHHCARCGHENGGVLCSAVSENQGDHIFAGRGDAAGCICINGRHWPHVDPVYGTEYEHDSSTHWYTFECKTCGYSTKRSEEPHVYLAPLTYECDAGTCNVIGTCVCGLTGAAEEHSSHLAGDISSVVSLNDSEHQVRRFCARSGKADMVADDPAPHNAQTAAAYENRGDSGHAHKVTCALALCDWEGTFTEAEPHAPVPTGGYVVMTNGHAQVVKCDATGCDWTGLGGTSPHGPWRWTLSASRSASDIHTCGDCGHEDLVAHSWVYNENVHYCSQDGQMHLYGEHDGTSPCYCGYVSGSHVEVTRCGCGCGVCEWRRVYDGNDHLLSESTSCKNDPNLTGSCQCVPCQNGKPTWCYCAAFNESSGRLSICDTALNGDHIGYAGSASLELIDMDDPVRDVGEYALRGSFRNCPNLTTFKGNYITNVAREGFARCFTSCPSLKSVQLARLRSTGFAAFNMAFDGCHSLTNLTLPALVDAYGGSFSGNGSLKSVSLPSLTFYDGLFDDCGSLESIHLPAVTSIEGQSFYGCPSLAVLNFGSTSHSFVPTVVGGVFHYIPSTAKIVVPDAQFEAWRSAPGWTNLVTQGVRFMRHSEWAAAAGL